jgi:hypothetical protein
MRTLFISFRPSLILTFCLFSALGVSLVYLSVESHSSSFSQFVWVIYAIPWLVVNALFGGIHNAPAWSFIPITVIAVVGTNFLVWYLVARIIGFVRRHDDG